MTKKDDKVNNFLGKINIIAKRRRNKMRSALTNTELTLLAPDCIGGILFHDLGLKFMSPTVNLMIRQPEFFCFVMNLEKYLAGEFEFFEHHEYRFPCAVLKAAGLPEITVHFTHYQTKEIALQKWNERKKRIRWDNMFILLEERDGITEEQLRMLGGATC